MKNSTLTYILSSTAVMQFKDDDCKFIEKIPTPNKFGRYTSHWRVTDWSKMTSDERTVLDHLLTQECSSLVPIKSVTKTVMDFLITPVTHCITQYPEHYVYHVTVGDREESIVIASTRELLSNHRYGIGHLINYLDQE